MEINRYDDIMGVVTSEAIPEGRMVLMTSHSQDHDFGSRTDLPAVKLPDTSTEAARARFCITWSVDNAVPPLYEPYPTFSYALRQGFDQAANVPFTAKVRLTQPSMQEGEEIPASALALAFGPGVYTVPSGCYVYSANFATPGTFLAVCDTSTEDAATAGKLKYSASATFADVIKYDSTTGNLTFRILY